ncbi:Tudor domain-containing protein 1 [Papilio xuthus]|uniref:Tudor domain-containing protein 1 n=1 Tax=Papilio xuthus TaxID=66420 RepID=A0A194QAJ9_PAPXU|nr:Tudor domain-containing protein 1 [Papilio xuthus]
MLKRALPLFKGVNSIQYRVNFKNVKHKVDNSMQLKLPGLQRDASRACVSCGMHADAYCSRCAVTPYCSLACQQRDWSARHHAVCHNLARLAVGNAPNPVSTAPTNLPTKPPAAESHDLNNQWSGLQTGTF